MISHGKDKDGLMRCVQSGALEVEGSSNGSFVLEAPLLAIRNED